MNSKEQIVGLLRSTQRNGIENVIALLEDSDFFTVGCHSHHKYIGGMADHALQTLALARRRGWKIPQDSLVITCLLHDICDINRYREVRNHGSRSATLLTKFCNLELSQDEWNAIRYHMKRRRHRPVRSPLELAVYTADKRSADRKHGRHA